MTIKSYAKKKFNQYKEDYAEQQKFNKTLSGIKRDAYRKQLLKEAVKQGTKQGKDKFKPKKTIDFGNFGNSTSSGKPQKKKNPFEIDLGF